MFSHLGAPSESVWQGECYFVGQVDMLGLDIRYKIRNLLYPGLDLHTRNRESLVRFWQTGPRDVLDAGSGNGYFSWLAYRSGAHVVAINYGQEQVEKARHFLIGYRRADPSRLQFERRNLYELARETRTFDEILCFEVLEHLRRDRDVVVEFYRILKPGGTLHLCCPNRLHPRHEAEVLDTKESGGHVRAGYTEEDYRKLLEPVGFKIGCVVGIGTPAVYHADRILRAIRNRLGDWAALPLFPITLPTVWFARFNPRVPFSLYVKATKPTCGI
jgi:SAM-dependent methyltransferase